MSPRRTKSFPKTLLPKDVAAEDVAAEDVAAEDVCCRRRCCRGARCLLRNRSFLETPVAPPSQARTGGKLTSETGGKLTSETGRTPSSGASRRRPGIPTSSRRIEDQFTLVSQPPGCALGLSRRPPAPRDLRTLLQPRRPRAFAALGRGLRARPRHRLQPSPPTSAGATPGLGATVAVLEPTCRAPVYAKLGHLIALALREAACDPAPLP